MVSKMLLYVTALVAFSMLGSLSGTILNCCDQGQKIGSRQMENPECSEKNLDYTAAGRVSRSQCKKVFLSCCQSTAMEQYCKVGVQSAINGAACKNATGPGGDMKQTCCNCCKEGIDSARDGKDCAGMTKEDMLCKESFKACCDSTLKTLATTKGIDAVMKFDAGDTICRWFDVQSIKSLQCYGRTSTDFVCPLLKVAYRIAPQTTVPPKKIDCKALGCEHSCKEKDGGVRCECNSGFRLKADGKTCEDVDECIEGLATCDAGNLCQNQAGSYMCVKQPDVKDKPCKKEGYIRDYDGNCVDEDECASGTAICGDGQYCINTDGYYACFRRCPYGYTVSGRNCVDVDECAISRPCQNRYRCVNKKGYYSCVLASCERGYQLRNGHCRDIDECALGLHKCGKRYACKNTIGFYNCELSSCSKGFKLVGGQCVDRNECLENPSICGKGKCFNSYGGHSCGCYTGYSFNSNTQRCEDINECTRSPGICEYDCMNTEGSYKCACPPGYLSVGNNCEDVDECSLFSKRCPSDHVCVNEHGNFTCINASCPNAYYIQRSPYECKLFCPGNHGKCSDMIIRSIKWTSTKFRKVVLPRQFQFSYTLRVSSYLHVQINFALVSGNEGGEFYLQRRNENTVDIINIKKLQGPRRYTLQLDVDILYNGKLASKYVYFNYISISKYSF